MTKNISVAHREKGPRKGSKAGTAHDLGKALSKARKTGPQWKRGPSRET